MSVLASVTPSDWTEQKFGALFERAQQVGFPELQPLSVFLGDGVVPRSARDDNHNQLGADLSKYQRVQPADIVFNKLRTWQGGIGVSNYEGIVSPAYIVCRPRGAAVEPRFAHHLLRSAPYLAELTRLSKWMPPSQFDISWDEIRTLSLGLPPINDQQRIADSLDDQVSRIDNIIAARRSQQGAIDDEDLASMADALSGGWPRAGRLRDRLGLAATCAGHLGRCSSIRFLRRSARKDAGPRESGRCSPAALSSERECALVRHRRHRPSDHVVRAW